MKYEGKQSAERDLVGLTRRFALEVIMNSMKRVIGWSYSRNREMRMQLQSNGCRQRTRNC